MRDVGQFAQLEIGTSAGLFVHKGCGAHLTLVFSGSPTRLAKGPWKDAEPQLAVPEAGDGLLRELVETGRDSAERGAVRPVFRCHPGAKGASLGPWLRFGGSGRPHLAIPSLSLNYLSRSPDSQG